MQINIDWQRRYLPQVKRILKDNAAEFISVEEASDDEDKHHATDFNIIIVGGVVAVRIRRSDCRYRDWTIRSRILQGKTELAKLLDGYGDWYLYCWTNKNAVIKEWILIDLERVRSSNLLNIITKKPDIPNGDGTYFKSVSIGELNINDCLLVLNIKEYQPQWKGLNV